MKFNGIDPRTLHPGITIAKEIPPGTVSSQIETLGGSTGEIIVGRTIKQAEYVVRINIAGKYRVQGWEIRKLLAAWACSSDVVTHELIPTNWPDVAYDAILKEISPPEFTFGFATVDVIFTLPRPIAKRIYPTMVQSKKDEKEVEAAIAGTYFVKPTITINTRSAEGLSVKVDGKTYIALTGIFEDGDVVSIHTDPPMVQVASDNSIKPANDRINYTETDFESLCKALYPGVHKVSCDEAEMINMRWRDEWL